jgi:predicted nucleic acid-binding protein
VNYLLDTCVISELVSNRPNQKVVDWVDSLESEQVYLSVITIGEITKGIERLPESKRKRDLEVWLHHELLPRFRGMILPLSTDVLIQWGTLLAHLEAAGNPMPAIDSLIAATVITYGVTLVTRNVVDFESAGVNMINPWE